MIHLKYDNANFNPHFRKGSDSGGWRNAGHMVISIHTSAREVTDENSFINRWGGISIHTSAREVTNQIHINYRNGNISIHTSAREVTVKLQEVLTENKISIHTSAREVTLPCGSFPSSNVLFQSTLPQGK